MSNEEVTRDNVTSLISKNLDDFALQLVNDKSNSTKLLVVLDASLDEVDQVSIVVNAKYFAGVFFTPREKLIELKIPAVAQIMSHYIKTLHAKFTNRPKGS